VRDEDRRLENSGGGPSVCDLVGWDVQSPRHLDGEQGQTVRLEHADELEVAIADMVRGRGIIAATG
jgi:hypothetical protein